jgi:transposase-like protein
MAANPKTNLSPSPFPEQVQEVLTRAVESGLENLSLRELLGLTISTLGQAERQVFLDRHEGDKGNGHYKRSVQLGSIPVGIQVARARSGEFRPTVIPGPYERSYPEEMQNLLLGLLTSSRSVNAAKEALGQLGLSQAGHNLDEVANELIEEIELRNSRPIDPDLLALFVDGKYIEVREGDRLRPCCLYVAIGLGRDGKKRILACSARVGRENLEDWKTLLRSLLERGLRRVLIVVQDDFPGLSAVNKGLFPGADVQLCIVHMQRNARSHLGKADNPEFQQRMRQIKLCWDESTAQTLWEELCTKFEATSPTFIALLRKKRDMYLAFLKYPETIRRTLSTTNAVEAVNGQLEIVRRNNGGYFHSTATLNLKLGIAVTRLENGRWRRAAVAINAALGQLNAIFERRFETD